MKLVLPGAAIGLLGGGENARLFASAARRMGYRVHVYAPDSDAVARLAGDTAMQRPFDDLISVREFASRVEVVTVVSGDVPAETMLAAADVTLLRPSASVFEAAVNSTAEFTVVGARGAGGECVFYRPVANDYVEGILDVARSPASLNGEMTRQAVATTRDLFGKLDLIGVACVGFSMTPDQELVMGGVFPYPHASGLLTIDACVTSQFEQHLRAVCGLPLGSAEMLKPAATAMLRDELSGEPDWVAAYALPAVKLHRGHVTATAASATLAKQIVLTARSLLTSHHE